MQDAALLGSALLTLALGMAAHRVNRRPALLGAVEARERALEEQLGCPLVAYEPETPYAPLTDEQLAALRRTEAELGVQLLAYRPDVAQQPMSRAAR